MRRVFNRLTTARSYLNPPGARFFRGTPDELASFRSFSGMAEFLPGKEFSMSMVIREDCINCGNCEPSCPNQAISAGESIYRIDSERCTECVGAFEAPQCVDVCPIEGCIAVDPAHTESQDILRERYQRLHPN
jgi:ferredoxin